jgi:F0F1-type ATP synthase membrane subunit b/b'
MCAGADGGKKMSLNENEDKASFTQSEIILLIDLAFASKLFYDVLRLLSCERIKKIVEQLNEAKEVQHDFNKFMSENECN